VWNGYGVCSNLASSGEPPPAVLHMTTVPRPLEMVTGTASQSFLVEVTAHVADEGRRTNICIPSLNFVGLFVPKIWPI